MRHIQFSLRFVEVPSGKSKKTLNQRNALVYKKPNAVLVLVITD